MGKYLARRANFLVLLVLVVICGLVGVLTWDRVNAASAAREWSEHSYEVLGTVKDLSLAVQHAETGQRGYILTGKDDYLAPYKEAVAHASFFQGELQRLTAYNHVEQARLKALSPVLQQKLEELAQTVELRRTVGFDAALAVVMTDRGRNDMKQIEATLLAMATDERDLLAAHLAQSENRGLWLRWLVAGGSLFAVVALIGAAALLNLALSRSSKAEADQRTLALRLRASLDSLSQGVGVFGRDGSLTNWNHCFQVLLDIPEVILKSATYYEDLVKHTSEQGDFLETTAQIRHGRAEPAQPVTYVRKLRDDHELELRRTGTPDGGFVLTVTDMTKRAQAESVLREAQKMQAIGQLTGGIAHDFNNLLTVILGTIEFVRSKLDAHPDMQTRLDRATWAAQRGATLTSQLLAFARKQALAPTPIDLAATMPDLIPLLRRTLGEQIDVRYVETAGLWPALADPAQLEAAVLNMALNARDAMPGGGCLTIELANKVLDSEYAAAHSEVTAGDYAMVAVSDTGHGMTPEIISRVFEPFFTTKPDGKGTGLGLAMVFGFVKQSKGHVKIYSEPGEGTTIRLYLPRANSLPAAQRANAPTDIPGGSATILVVEDEPAVREIAVEILAELGYRVLEAAEGDEALRIFGAHAAEIDLLLTDVVLPGKMKGRDVAERITSMRPEVKVLFMSGYTENSIVHQGRLDDGVNLIGKPFRREQLARKVADLLGDHQSGAIGENVIPIGSRRS